MVRCCIYMLAPTSPEQRVRLVAEKSSGFIYLVSLTGVTGAREALPLGVEEFVSSVRAVASQPLCLGFGISTPEQAERMARVSDGIIVGSKLIDLAENGDLSKLEAFVASVRARVLKPAGSALRKRRTPASRGSALGDVVAQRLVPCGAGCGDART